ncbi:MAG: hypothetical protein AAFX40_14110, partial [Cyanobacteria bacterium J06639_1]
MNDADIRQLLDDAIARPNLTVQVEGLDRHLHVLLVSESNAIADLSELGELIAEEVGTFVSDIDELTIWARCRGDETARRLTTIALSDEASPASPS